MITGKLLCEMLLGDGFQGVLEGEMLTWACQGKCFCSKAACEMGMFLSGKPVNGWRKLASLAERYKGKDFQTPGLEQGKKAARQKHLWKDL